MSREEPSPAEDETASASSREFFKGLTELRALAALGVLLHHLELFKFREGEASLFDIPTLHHFITHVGKNGVYLFFTLSGFLITYLLLDERRRKGSIDLGSFYARRIFRIWPLYYTVFVLSVVAVPNLATTFDVFAQTPSYFRHINNADNYGWSSILAYLFFVPNVALIYFKHVVVGMSQAWSVGVEEQYYLVWPLLVMRLRGRGLVIGFGLIVAAALLGRVVGVGPLAAFFSVVPIEYMAIGAFGGFLYFHRRAWVRRWTQSRALLAGIYGAVAALMVVDFRFAYLQTVALSGAFLALIITTIDDRNRLSMRHPFLFRVGNISYGVYMYHPLVMFLVFPQLIGWFSPAPVAANVALYLAVPALVVAVSALSFRYLEKPFIQLKDRRFSA